MFQTFFAEHSHNTYCFSCTTAFSETELIFPKELFRFCCDSLSYMYTFIYPNVYTRAVQSFRFVFAPGPNSGPNSYLVFVRIVSIRPNTNMGTRHLVLRMPANVIKGNNAATGSFFCS